jgi:hypothetical protein
VPRLGFDPCLEIAQSIEDSAGKLAVDRPAAAYAETFKGPCAETHQCACLLRGQ